MQRLPDNTPIKVRIGGEWWAGVSTRFYMRLVDDDYQPAVCYRVMLPCDPPPGTTFVESTEAHYGSALVADIEVL